MGAAMNSIIKMLEWLIPLLLVGAVVAAIVLLWRVRKSEHKEVEGIIAGYKTQLTGIELNDRQLNFARLRFFPALEESIRMTQKYNSGFFLVATIPIGATVAGSCIAVLTSGLLSAWAVWGLAAIGLLSACQAGWAMFNSFVQTGQRYSDAVDLRYQLETCITELLEPTPHIPTGQQFAQFMAEFKKIRDIAHSANQERISSAQRASQLISDQAKETLERSREAYKSRWQNEPQINSIDRPTQTIEASNVTPEFSPLPEIELELLPEVDNLFATVDGGGPAEYIATHAGNDEVVTIGDTGMTPAQFIEISMGGEDDDTAVFLNQGGVINEP